MVTTCLNCSAVTSYKYCCLQCQMNYQYKKYIKSWKKGDKTGTRGTGKTMCISRHVRRYLFEINNNECSRCKWGEVNPYTNKIPLEIHHKDGDWTNCTYGNLELLCPNCHSLTETHRGANTTKACISRDAGGRTKWIT